MRKKLTIEEIKFRAEGFGKWIILDDYYEGAHTKLECQCIKCGYIFKRTASQIQKNAGCVECARRSNFLSIEYIKKEAFKRGWLVLSDDYENKFTKLNCKCIKCGHETQFVWQSIQQNIRCKKCNKTTRLEFIRAEFRKKGCRLLTTEYKNAHQKLEYVCPKGKNHKISWMCHQRGHKCSCYSNSKKLTIEFIRAEFKKEGYELLTGVYDNSKQKLEYICSGPEKHKHNVTWGAWKDGDRCPYCSGNAKLTIEFIRAEFAKEDYILLSTIYVDNKTKLDYICPRGHKHSITWNDWNSKKKYRCPFCSNHISKWEKEVKKFLTESNIDHIPNDRVQLTNPETGHKLELDIWMSDLNKAIECNGMYWHKNRQHVDLLKKQLCKNQGIDLLVITDKEWNEDIDRCKAKLISFVRVGA